MAEFDHIIVGAGSAGCVLANRLSAAGRKILLLEAGGRDNNPWLHIPVGYLFCISNPRTDWMYRTVAEERLGGRSLIYPRGKVLGGCSSINGMIYIRGQSADYDGWRQSGLTGWGWDDVLPYFKRSQDDSRGPDGMHGAGGPLRVEDQRLRWSVLDDWRDAAVAAGIPETRDFNRGDNFGVSYFRVNQRRGVRWSAAKAFLRPARDRVRVETRAWVERLEIEGGRAVGVVWHRDGRRHVSRAGGDVVLSAGAIGSPAILQLSGIGPAAALAEIGVGIAADAPEVGKNLQDHLQLRCVYRLSGARTLNTLANSYWGRAGILAEYALNRSGPMAMSPSQLGAFAKSRPDVATPDLEYHVQPLSLDAFGEPLHRFPALTASVCNLRPESRGVVRITSRDFRRAPSIRPNYLSTPGDRRVAVDAIRLTRRIMGERPLSRYAPEEVAPGPEIEDREELEEAAGRIGATIFHPVGTVRMGADAAAPLDGELRMRAVGNLRVVDASAMPRITSGNTNAPTIMIAEKASDMILDRSPP